MNGRRAFLRWRLNVPEVHALVGAQQRMLDNWAETAPGSPERRAYWQALHDAGNNLADALVGRSRGCDQEFPAEPTSARPEPCPNACYLAGRCQCPKPEQDAGRG